MLYLRDRNVRFVISVIKKELTLIGRQPLKRVGE